MVSCGVSDVGDKYCSSAHIFRKRGVPAPDIAKIGIDYVDGKEDGRWGEEVDARRAWI